MSHRFKAAHLHRVLSKVDHRGVSVALLARITGRSPPCVLIIIFLFNQAGLWQKCSNGFAAKKTPVVAESSWSEHGIHKSKVMGRIPL